MSDPQKIRQVRTFSQRGRLLYDRLMFLSFAAVFTFLCSGLRSSQRRFHGAVVFSLGLLSVFLLAALIGLCVTCGSKSHFIIRMRFLRILGMFYFIYVFLSKHSVFTVSVMYSLLVLFLFSAFSHFPVRFVFFCVF